MTFKCERSITGAGFSLIKKWRKDVAKKSFEDKLWANMDRLVKMAPSEEVLEELLSVYSIYLAWLTRQRCESTFKRVVRDDDIQDIHVYINRCKTQLRSRGVTVEIIEHCTAILGRFKCGQCDMCTYVVVAT